MYSRIIVSVKVLLGRIISALRVHHVLAQPVHNACLLVSLLAKNGGASQHALVGVGIRPWHIGMKKSCKRGTRTLVARHFLYEVVGWRD